MKFLNHPFYILSAGIFFCISAKNFAQEGIVNLHQDKKIDELLVIKKNLIEEHKSSGIYKIQIFSGKNRSNASAVKSNFLKLHSELPSTLVFNSPEYRVWVGNFKSRLEADKALVSVKKDFPNAFVFKPKKED